MNGASNSWPALPFAEWKDTAMTLHMWTQIVGKIRMTLSPWTNHSCHVTFYVTSRGLTTSPIPHGMRTFEIRFDFIDHQLRILTSFFFQAEDGIRDRNVTGVQTCALPICRAASAPRCTASATR